MAAGADIIAVDVLFLDIDEPHGMVLRRPDRSFAKGGFQIPDAGGLE